MALALWRRRVVDSSCMAWWYMGACSGSGSVLESLPRKLRVSSPMRPWASKSMGTMGWGAYLRRLYCSREVLARPGVMEEAWLPAKAAVVKAEVTMMSMWTGPVEVNQVTSALLRGLGVSSGWLVVAVGLSVGRTCSMSGVWPVVLWMMVTMASRNALWRLLRWGPKEHDNAWWSWVLVG